MNFSLLNTHPGSGATPITSAGGSATFVYNVNGVLGLVGDLGGYHNPNDANSNPTTFTYLFGPRVSFRRSRFIPYAQALFGGARQWNSFVDPTTGPSTSQNGFAAAVGGGLDIRMRDHILVKPVQLEYVATQVSNPWSSTGSQNNLRYSAGVVFTFGSK
jgi:hypothetical protein